MIIATAAYPLDPVASFDAYAAKQDHWAARAAAQGAGLLVFPEYGRMELAALEGPAIAGDLAASLRAVDRHTARANDLVARLARKYRLHILAASGPVFDGRDRPVNRATLFGPKGVIGHQDKQVMTRFERETWDVGPGGPLRVFDTALGKIGILICYDAEFPLLGRALAEAGAEILLVPSCTDTEAGYARVRIGAMARALENQCVVVQSPTVGAAPGRPPSMTILAPPAFSARPIWAFRPAASWPWARRTIPVLCWPASTRPPSRRCAPKGPCSTTPIGPKVPRARMLRRPTQICLENPGQRAHLAATCTHSGAHSKE